MKNSTFLFLIIALTAVCLFTLGCDSPEERALLRTYIQLAQNTDIDHQPPLPFDAEHDYPEIADSGELEPGRYLMRVYGSFSDNDALLYVSRDVGDPADRFTIQIHFNPVPKHTRGGWWIVAPNPVDDMLVYDVIAVEITEQKSTIPMYFGTGEHGKRFRYEGILLKNLSDPDIQFDVEDRLLE